MMRAIRRAMERVPVLGPTMIFAYRKVRAFGRPKPKDVVPARFLKLYKERNQITDLDRIDDPVKQLHVRFALSTVERGRRSLAEIASVKRVRGKRCLDVGCAYGGFLVAFSEGGASRVVGIDIDPSLLDYARALLADHELSAEVRELDVLDRDRSLELGRFDIVTCNDVIEHVLDPAKALHNLGALLADDGMLYLQIPNRWSASSVLADGHYRIFGLTTLPKKHADEYFRRRFNREQDVTYKSLPFYINQLARLGYSTRVVHETPVALAPRLEKIAGIFADCERLANGDVPPLLAHHVRRTARAFRTGHEKYRRLLASDKRAAEKLGAKLWLAFGTDFFLLFVERSPKPRMVSWSTMLPAT